MKIKDIYIDDASYQYYVLTNLGLNVTKCTIVTINNKYVRNGNIDLNELFIKQDITNEVKDLLKKVKIKIVEAYGIKENVKIMVFP